MTNFAATSRSAILPSGEMSDRVMPGMLSVVACGRTRGVAEPEFCRRGGLQQTVLAASQADRFSILKLESLTS
jgi:hypothetical protein